MEKEETALTAPGRALVKKKTGGKNREKRKDWKRRGAFMKTELSLLDLLSLQMNCTYLSDLRGLDDGLRAMMSRRLEQLPARAEELHDWNDALEYLTGAPPEETAQAAKERLIALLSQPRLRG